MCACNHDTYATFEAQFMAKLRNTETDLKKSVACKKKRVFDLHGWMNITCVLLMCYGLLLFCDPIDSLSVPRKLQSYINRSSLKLLRRVYLIIVHMLRSEIWRQSLYSRGRGELNRENLFVIIVHVARNCEWLYIFRVILFSMCRCIHGSRSYLCKPSCVYSKCWSHKWKRYVLTSTW